ncbi:MAG: Lrp/AsnC ligand binding domain-containing protein [Candidatus Odinarchaeota archaeon]
MGQQIKFLSVCLTSGLLISLYIMLDAFVAHYLVTDPVVLSLVTMWVGIVPSFLLLLLFNGLKVKKKKLGKSFDPEFRNIKLPSGKPFYYLLIAAAFGAVSTLAYYLSLAVFDASMMLPLMQFVTIYLIAADFLTEKEMPVAVEIQAITMITLGAILMTVNNSGFDMAAMTFVLIFLNLPATMVTVFQSKARNHKDEKGQTVDSLNLRMWYVIGLTATITVISAPLVLLDSGRIEILFSTRWEAIVMVFTSMMITFLALALFIRALAMGKMAIVNAFTSVNIIFTALLSIAGSLIFPEVYQFPFSDPLLVFLRIAGALLLIVGIFSLSLTDSYIYIFIKLESTAQYRTPEIMKLIKDIKGVNAVSSVCGVYDLIATARIRTLGRANSLIVKKISLIPGLKKTDTRAAIYHWERN